MTAYSPADNFSGINIYDTSDPVLGGTSGQSNDPIKALADRTHYINNRLGRYLAHRRVTSAGTITPTDRGKLIHAISTANISLTLDAVATFPVGTIITVKAKTQSTGKAIRIVPNASEAIEDGVVNHATAGLYLHDGEAVVLMAGDADANGTADYWELISFDGNLYKAGNDDLVRFAPRNTLVADGSVVNRADHPRLWAIVSATAIADATWLSDPVRYREQFSTGNTTTTFRLPDMRSMFMRALDLGRGLSVDRLDNVAGGYEADEFKSHNHTNGNYNRLVQQNGLNTGTSFDNSAGEIDCRTGGTMANAGGAETRPRNAGFTPIIYY